MSPGRMVEQRRVAVKQSFGRARRRRRRQRGHVARRQPSRRRGDNEGVGVVGAVRRSSRPSGSSGHRRCRRCRWHQRGAGQSTARRRATRSPLGSLPSASGAWPGDLLPTTRREEQAVRAGAAALESAAESWGRTRGRWPRGAKEHATEAAEHLKATAQDATESVKAEAQDATESVKADAQEAATETEEAAAGTEDTKRA